MNLKRRTYVEVSKQSLEKAEKRYANAHPSGSIQELVDQVLTFSNQISCIESMLHSIRHEVKMNMMKKSEGEEAERYLSMAKQLLRGKQEEWKKFIYRNYSN